MRIASCSIVGDPYRMKARKKRKKKEMIEKMYF